MSSSSSSSFSCPCEIRWANGTAIADGNRNVLPGHQINLKIFCDGTPTITDIEWFLPGKVFKSYTTSEDTGTLTNLAEGDLDDLTVTFYWADVGDGRLVQVNFKMNGNQCYEEATLNVKDLGVAFPTVGGQEFDPPPIGEPVVDDVDDDRIELANAYAGESNGIVFKATVTIPAGFGFGQGKWHYGQLVEELWIRKASDQTCSQVNSDGYENSTGGWPYWLLADPITIPWDTGTTVGTVKNTPSMAFGANDQLRADLKFRMYIMFKPAADPPGAGESAYVPLRVSNYNTDWCAEKNGTWAIKSSGAVSAQWAVERNHPTWTGYSGDNTSAPCVWPGPC